MHERAEGGNKSSIRVISGDPELAICRLHPPTLWARKAPAFRGSVGTGADSGNSGPGGFRKTTVFESGNSFFLVLCV